MPRKLRIQYAGALYHVINRGNYRRDVFESAGAAQAFIAVLEEVLPRFGWRLHAYVIMRNHFHLALETSRPIWSRACTGCKAPTPPGSIAFAASGGICFRGATKPS